MAISVRALNAEEKAKKKHIVTNKVMKKHKGYLPEWDEASVVHHPIDAYILKDLRNGKVPEDPLFKELDNNLDGENGYYHVKWEDNDLMKLYEGMVARSLEILRYADPDKISTGEDISLFEEEIEWIASEEFDAICAGISYDANTIRASLPKILAKYKKPLVGRVANLINAFDRLRGIGASLTEHENLAGFGYKGKVVLGNESTFNDVHKSMALPAGVKSKPKKTKKAKTSIKSEQAFFSDSIFTY